MSSQNQKNFSQVHIRIPNDVRARLDESAALNERTLNGEVVYQLKKAYETAHKEKAEPST